jgi:hypothetical protein
MTVQNDTTYNILPLSPAGQLGSIMSRSRLTPPLQEWHNFHFTVSVYVQGNQTPVWGGQDWPLPCKNNATSTISVLFIPMQVNWAPEWGFHNWPVPYMKVTVSAILFLSACRASGLRHEEVKIDLFRGQHFKTPVSLNFFALAVLSQNKTFINCVFRCKKASISYVKCQNTKKADISSNNYG